MPSPASERAEAPSPAVRWGIADAVAGFLVAFFSSLVLGSIVLGVAGEKSTESASLVVIAFLQATLWVGLLGAPVVATRRRGNGVVEDLGLRLTPTDVPLGIAVGLACQFLLVPAVSYPWIVLLGQTTEDLEQPARELADKADDPIGVGLLFLIVVLGAPIIEELFFRGLLLRSVARRVAPVAAAVISAVVFALTHFQLLQFPALLAFGVVLAVLALRTGRLGPGVVAHMAFNAATVVSLVLRS